MPKKAEVKAEKHGFIEGERHSMTTMSEKDKEQAVMMLASHPIKTYLIAMLDELVRQGIYLSWEEQEGAKMMVKILGGELEKGAKLIERQEKMKRMKEKKDLSTPVK